VKRLSVFLYRVRFVAAALLLVAMVSTAAWLHDSPSAWKLYLTGLLGGGCVAAVAGIGKLRALQRWEVVGQRLSRTLSEDPPEVPETTAGASSVDEQTHELADRLHATVEATRTLRSRSTEISEILKVIHDITDQTHLLAINASIIAAQAGDEGRGFGVVAEEMRNLSERAASSSRETEILAENLRDEVAHAARDIIRSGEALETLRGSVRELDDSLRALRAGRKAENQERRELIAELDRAPGRGGGATA
jgi:chromosome segregation ATPase